MERREHRVHDRSSQFRLQRLGNVEKSHRHAAENQRIGAILQALATLDHEPPDHLVAAFA